MRIVYGLDSKLVVVLGLVGIVIQVILFVTNFGKMKLDASSNIECLITRSISYSQAMLLNTSSSNFTDDMEIMIRTYHHDSIYLPYTLRSIEKHAPSLRSRVTLVYPFQDEKAIRTNLADLWDSVTHFRVQESGASTKGGYDDQQFNKLDADLFISSKYIMHFDSDCIMIAAYKDGFVFDQTSHKPWNLISHHSKFPWADYFRKNTAFFLGLQHTEVEYEYMRRFPFVHPREVYQMVRRQIAHAHAGLSITEVFRHKQKYIAKNNIHLSEYNLIGATAHLFGGAHLFSWCVEDKCTAPPQFVVQFQDYKYKAKPNQTEVDRQMCQAMGLTAGCLKSSIFYKESRES